MTRIYLKYRTLTYLILLVASSVLLSCEKENRGDCFKSTGEISSETRLLEPFSRLEVEDNVNVYIHFAPEHSAVVEAGQNLISSIETEVVDHTLYIRNNNTCNWVRKYNVPVNVTLHCTQIDFLISRGYGTIETLDTIVQTEFYAEQWLASGRLELLLNTERAYIKSHTGPADYSCHGSSNYLYAYNSSSGMLHLEGVKAQNAMAWNTGNGNIYVNVSDSLEILLDDIGDVHYTGNPAFLNVNRNGSGKAIPF